MRRKIKSVMLLSYIICIIMTTFSACSSEEIIDDLIPVETILEKGMIKLTNNVGEWDVNVIYEKDGYIFLKENDEAVESLYLQFMSPLNDYDCCILADKTNYLPEVLSFPDETYYFDNLGDTIVVSLSTEETFEVLDTIPFEISGYNSFSKSQKALTTITYLNRDDKIQKVVKALNAILNAGENYTSSQVKRLKKALDNISMFYYYENVEDIIDELDLCRQEYGEEGDSIIYCFSQYATKAKIKTFNSARYGVTVKTRMGAEVYCNSAIVSGRIFCSNRQVSEKGKWGIIYAKDRHDLNFESENAQIVYATEKDFIVKLRNLDMNTTYYYATFYKFNSKDHGDLYHHYGPKDAEYYVDSWPNSFKTVELVVEMPKVASINSTKAPYYERTYYGNHVVFEVDVEAGYDYIGDESMVPNDWGITIFCDGEPVYSEMIAKGEVIEEGTTHFTLWIEKDQLNIDKESFEATTEGRWEVATYAYFEELMKEIYGEKVPLNLVYDQEPSMKFRNISNQRTEKIEDELRDEDKPYIDRRALFDYELEITGGLFFDDFYEYTPWVEKESSTLLFKDGITSSLDGFTYSSSSEATRVIGSLYYGALLSNGTEITTPNQVVYKMSNGNPSFSLETGNGVEP